MKKKVKNVFPDSLYIWFDEDEIERYPVLALTLDKLVAPDEAEIGIYALQSVGKLKRTTTIE